MRAALDPRLPRHPRLPLLPCRDVHHGLAPLVLAVQFDAQPRAGFEKLPQRAKAVVAVVEAPLQLPDAPQVSSSSSSDS